MILLPTKTNVALGSAKSWWVDIQQDEFVHFTSQSKAASILATGLIPHEVSVIGVHGVSTVYGKYAQTTQTAHLTATPEDPIVAVVFKTGSTPVIGFVDEVIWPQDIPVLDARVISETRGAALVASSPVKIDDNDIAIYDMAMRPEASVRIAARVLARYKSKKTVKTKDGEDMTVYEYSDRQIAHRNKTKAKRLEKLRSKIGDLRTQVAKDMKSDDPATFLTALAVALIDHTYERVGNEGSADEGHYGVTGWTRGHVSFRKGKATVKYVGKSGVKHEKVVSDAKIVKALRDAYEAAEDGDDSPLFAHEDAKVDARKVNAYLEQFDVTAKDLRGFHANNSMVEELREERKKGGALPDDKKKREKQLKAEFLAALDRTAETVGHEPGTLRSQYLVPGLESEYLDHGKILANFEKSAFLLSRVVARYLATL